MSKQHMRLRVSSKEYLTAHHVLLRLTHDQPLPVMLPGQFLMARVDNAPHTFLRRPFSIHYVDYARNELLLLIHIVGEGTAALARLDKGDSLDSLLPLGHGFTLPAAEERRVLLVGGGVGVAPLLFLGAEVRRRGGQPTFLIGAKTRGDLLAIDTYSKVGEVCVTTEDGTQGERGMVTEHSILSRTTFDRIQVCGPTAMMRAVARYAMAQEVDCEVSLEHLMACGVGACLCCVAHTLTGHRRVCVDGPVFNVKELLWHD